jgi:DNA-directed RNA polymerase subunit RPC12/RpoP
MNGTSSHDQDGPPGLTGQSAHPSSTPARTPPQLLCPACEQALVHQQTVTGRIDRIERHDGFACQACGGFFLYHDRTASLRRAPVVPNTGGRRG